MSDEVAVDTRISLELNPGILPAMDIYDDDTAPVLGQAERAIGGAFNALCAIHDAKAAAETDPTMTPEGRLLAVDDYAAQRITPVLKAWDEATNALENNIASYTRDMHAPVVAKASQMISGEVRSYFKSLPQGERVEAMRAAIDRGDEVSVSAVLGGPSYLSGLTDEMQQQFLIQWNERANPLQAKRLRAMTTALDMLNKRGGLVHKGRIDAVGHIEVRTKMRGGPDHVQRITPSAIRNKRDKARAAFAIPASSCSKQSEASDDKRHSATVGNRLGHSGRTAPATA